MFSTAADEVFPLEMDAGERVPQRIKELVEELIGRGISASELASQILGRQPAIRAGRRPRKPWKSEEIKQLLVGVSWFGIGNWSRIHSSMGFSSSRSFTDLKDKWRNLLDLRGNARTPSIFKKIAVCIRDSQMASRNVPMDLAQHNGDTSLESAFQDLEGKCQGMPLSDIIAAKGLTGVDEAPQKEDARAQIPRVDDPSWYQFGMEFDSEKEY